MRSGEGRRRLQVGGRTLGRGEKLSCYRREWTEKRNAPKLPVERVSLPAWRGELKTGLRGSLG